jgi:hypothetical protein
MDRPLAETLALVKIEESHRSGLGATKEEVIVRIKSKAFHGRFLWTQYHGRCVALRAP